MMLALAWLTISLPYVYMSQQKAEELTKTAHATTPLGANEEEAANPFGNTTEEKKPSGNSSFSEEYLHDHYGEDCFFFTTSRQHASKNAGVYTAFHGEVHVPPPNAA